MEWISIKDKLPLEKSDKRRIICVNVYNGVEVFPLRYEKAYLRGKVVYRWREAWGRIYRGPKITHWAPLPEPPGGKEGWRWMNSEKG